jgi:hypothetical protein
MKSQKLYYTIFIFMVLIFFFGLVPWNPLAIVVNQISDISVDVAFQVVANDLLRQGKIFGDGIIFTYGPLMYLAHAPLSSEYLVSYYVFRIAIALLPLALIFLITNISVENVIKKNFILIAFAVISYLWILGLNQAFWISSVALFIVAYFSPLSDNKKIRHYIFPLISSVIGSIALIKFNFFIISIWAIILIIFYDIYKKRLPYSGLSFVITILVIWGLYKQPYNALILWISLSFNLASGYGEAMAREFYGDYSLYHIILFYMGAFLPLSAIFLFEKVQIKVILRFIFFLGLAFVSLKHAFYGNQLQHACAVIILVILCIAISTIYSGTNERSTQSIMIGISILIGSLISITLLLFLTLNINFFSNDIYTIYKNQFNGFINLNSFHHGQNQWEKFRSDIRVLAPFPEINGTTDVYPAKTAVVLAQLNTTYQPRPAFLSLNAHTKVLAQLNADFLKTENAPKNIIFEIINPDYNNRLPSTFDGPSWLEILSRYSPQSLEAGFLILSKRGSPIGYTETNIIDKNLNFKQELFLNESGILFAKVFFQKSFFGKVVSALYRSPHITIVLVLDNGETKYYQLVPELGEAGFIISPLINTTDKFSKLTITVDGSEEIKLPNVKKILFISEPNTKWFYKDLINIRIQRINYSNSTHNEQTSKFANQDKLLSSVTNCLFPPEKIPEGVLMHAPCSSALPIPKKAKNISFIYGMRKSSYKSLNLGSGGAEFILWCSDGVSDNRKLWSQNLDPVNVILDRGPHLISINFESYCKNLIFETSIGIDKSPAYDHTYFGEVSYK